MSIFVPNWKCMALNIFRLVLTDEAQNFIESLPEAVSYKIYYNINWWLPLTALSRKHKRPQVRKLRKLKQSEKNISKTNNYGTDESYPFGRCAWQALWKVGTSKRDAFESDVDEALHAYRLGEAIKKARIEQNLTQEQLGERIGVKRAQISRLERGYSITIPTMRRVFKALGVVTATIDLGVAGKVALWWKCTYWT